MKTYRLMTLRSEIDEAKALYMKDYGLLDWRWHDEGIVYAIQGYHSCVGSVLDFTADDEAVLKENGLTINDAIEYCENGDVTEEMFRAAQSGWIEECVVTEASGVALFEDRNGKTHVFIRRDALAKEEYL